MKNTTMKRFIGAATLSVFAIGGLAACGGDDRPSSDEIGKAMMKGVEGQLGTSEIEKETYEKVEKCIGDTLHDSDLSDDALNEIVDAKDISKLDESDLSKDDQKVIDDPKLTQDMAACMDEVLDAMMADAMGDMDMPDMDDPSGMDGGEMSDLPTMVE